MKEIKRTNSICPPPEEILFNSVINNNQESIKTIIKSNPNLLTYIYPHTYKTILLRACEEKQVEATTIQTLIDLGVDLEGDEEWKPLHIAALNPNTSILKIIINNLQPGQINETVGSNTALLALIKHSAVKQNEEQYIGNIELLLEAGIDVNLADGKNLTAIIWAAKHGYKNIIKIILEKSVCHVDLDSHKLLNKTARELIETKKLYNGVLPGRILHQIPKDKIFSLIKTEKEDEFIKYFDTLSLTNPTDFVNLDDGTSTLLQYCSQKGLVKIAKYLVDRGANINKTVSNNTKNPLELSAENGYYDIVSVLINQPDVRITPNILCNLLKRYDDPKYDKINYEECSTLILDKLKLDKSLMDINEEDEFQNTCLHYSLRYCDEATTEKILNLGASLASKNCFDFMPIGDIKPELLERHLDNCVEFDIKDKNDEKRNFEVVFNYHSLLPPRRLDHDDTDPEINLNQTENLVPETEVIAYMSKAPEFQSLLKHPVIVSFLFMKWHKIRLLFYTNLLFYIIFVASLISYIFIYYTDSDFTNCDSFCKLSRVTLNLTFWILILRELFQMTVSPTNYFRNFENFVEIILIVITSVILYGDSSYDSRKQLASLAILLSAFELVLMVGQHPKLSTNVVMFKTVSVNFFKLLLWYSLLIIAFALSFYILFAKPQVIQNLNQTETDEDDLFMGPGKSLFKTIVMLTGEFDAGSIDFHTYPITSKLIFSLFVFMITIILLNLLNGLAVSDTQTIKNDAELVGHITRAQHIYYVESMLLGNILPTHLFKIIQKLFCCCPTISTTCRFLKPLGKRVCLFSDWNNRKLIVLPNNHGKIFYEFDRPSKRSRNSYNCSDTCRDKYLDKETTRKIISIVKMKRDTIDFYCGNNIEKLYAEIAALKTKLDCFKGSLMQNQKHFQ